MFALTVRKETGVQTVNLLPWNWRVDNASEVESDLTFRAIPENRNILRLCEGKRDKLWHGRECTPDAQTNQTASLPSAIPA